MIVLVCGGRKFWDYQLLSEVLYEIHDETPITKIINGGALGADSLSTRWAQVNNVSCKIMYANWTKEGKAAGILRNIRMLDEAPDLVVAFEGGKGTAHMIKIAKKAGVKIRNIAEKNNT